MIFLTYLNENLLKNSQFSKNWIKWSQFILLNFDFIWFKEFLYSRRKFLNKITILVFRLQQNIFGAQALKCASISKEINC